MSKSILAFPTTDCNTKRGSHPHITTWLNSISNLNYGTEKKLKFTTKRVIDMYNMKRHNTGPSKRMLIAHERGEGTIFYLANHRYSQERIHITGDIDAHKPGQTYDDCVDFVNMLAGMPMFENLYWERSTKGNGIHFSIWIEGRGHADVKRKACKRLEQYLRVLCDPFDCDVEIKGTPPSVKYDAQGKISSILMGCLCRLPRNLGAALHSTTIALHTLLLLEIPQIKQGKQGKGKQGKKSGGSTCILTEEYADQLPAIRRQVEYAFHKWGGELQQNGTHRTRIVDIILFVLTQRWLSDHPKPTGHTSCMRAKAVHDMIQQSDLLPEEYRNRAWHHERFKPIRDWFSDSLGIIQWQNNEYTPPTYDSQGNKTEGKACSWKLDFATLEALTTPLTTLIPKRSAEIMRPMTRDQYRLDIAWEFALLDQRLAG